VNTHKVAWIFCSPVTLCFVKNTNWKFNLAGNISKTCVSQVDTEDDANISVETRMSRCATRIVIKVAGM